MMTGRRRRQEMRFYLSLVAAEVLFLAAMFVAYLVGPRGALLPFLIVWAAVALVKKACRPFAREIFGTKKEASR